MGIHSWGPPPELIEVLQSLFPLEAFVETGTFEGKTTAWAAERFRRVYTIEASAHYYQLSKDSLKKFHNVDIRMGDTSLVLAELMPSLPPSLFYLDAHWSAGLTAGADHECPVITELELIRPWFKRHVVLIDDARFFLEPPIKPHNYAEWPSIDELIQVMNAAAYTVYYKDVLVMVPRIHRMRVEEAIRDLKASSQSAE